MSADSLPDHSEREAHETIIALETRLRLEINTGRRLLHGGAPLTDSEWRDYREDIPGYCHPPLPAPVDGQVDERRWKICGPTPVGVQGPRLEREESVEVVPASERDRLRAENERLVVAEDELLAANGRLIRWWDQSKADATEAWAEVERLRPALADLVRLKDGPRDDAYRAAKDAAWDAARAALAPASDDHQDGGSDGR